MNEKAFQRAPVAERTPVDLIRAPRVAEQPLLSESQERLHTSEGAQRHATSRTQAAGAVQRTQKGLRDLIDGLGPSMFVGSMTSQGILIEANRPALAAAGLKPEDVLGKALRGHMLVG